MGRTLIIVDANNFAFAAYHTHRTLCTSDGEETGLMYGVLAGLLALKRLFPGSPIIVAWDGPGKSWRKFVSPDRYKAQRNVDGNSVRDSCMSQVEKLIPIIDYLQIPQIRLRGVEADDLIGILTEELKGEFDHVIIRSSDKDFFQLLEPRVKILRGQIKRAKPLDKENVWDELITERKIPQGISPKRWTTFRALCGDSSDNLKGLVHGCGEVAAAALVNSGIKLPAHGFKGIKKISRLSKKEITDADWDRVNQNFLLVKILRDKDNDKLPEESRKELSKFLSRWRKCGFKRNLRKIDDWKLLKMLGRYEMDQMAARYRELAKIF